MSIYSILVLDQCVFYREKNSLHELKLAKILFNLSEKPEIQASLGILKSDSYARSPTLDTVMMIEKIIERHSGECNRTQIWKKLPKKVMWQTYLVAVEYLESINKIAIDSEGKVGDIWNPVLAKSLSKRKEIEL